MKTFKIFLLSLLLCCFQSVCAFEFTVDGINYMNIGTNECCVISGSYSGDIVIPETVDYNGEKQWVVWIYKDAFKGTDVTSVTVKGRLYLFDNCFRDCKKLTSVKLNVYDVYEDAFRGCSSLASVDMNGWYSSSLGTRCFSGCSSLTSVNLSGGFSSLGERCFGGCSSLQNITILDGVTSLGDYTFQGCSSLQNITIPESVTLLGNHCFQGCSSLSNITIPGVTVLNEGYNTP